MYLGTASEERQIFKKGIKTDLQSVSTTALLKKKSAKKAGEGAPIKTFLGRKEGKNRTGLQGFGGGGRSKNGQKEKKKKKKDTTTKEKKVEGNPQKGKGNAQGPHQKKKPPRGRKKLSRQTRQ